MLRKAYLVTRKEKRDVGQFIAEMEIGMENYHLPTLI